VGKTEWDTFLARLENLKEMKGRFLNLSSTPAASSCSMTLLKNGFALMETPAPLPPH
jgi:hypothetical protein